MTESADDDGGSKKEKRMHCQRHATPTYQSSSDIGAGAASTVELQHFSTEDGLS
eukprot:CAMPEP_0184687644 /NCGR_PEP_ID=MMETSP0312-20130426/27209_1 /TAXON_ID=31354 /ORGANISM="Compsopogon coeruleus, Strain SAG 36.94" /LENGTH=53 /DNA_ID=CAMNT_0027144017 /DNA_START=189 /DNA_END=350 /DNA_ORIENTATION=+